MNLKDNILKIGISLSAIGVKNWALSKGDALLALDKFYEMKVPVLGGDVCEIIEGIIQYNYDNWHCDRHFNESHYDFLNRSINQAKKYIQEYKSDKLDKTFFILVLEE